MLDIGLAQSLLFFLRLALPPFRCVVMFLSSPSTVSVLQSRPSHIRNLCIVAHVDHGKTTLSDYLLSSNGVISKALAGKVRYLDSRADEQERKITMKSSSIALVFQDKRKQSHNPATATPTTAAPAQPAPSTSTTSTPTDAASTASPASPDPVYLINLIDSPGHVDFSSEVSTAVRVSDGALVLVDVVEGLCVQTQAVMRAAWREGVRMVLVLNKIDRLITEVRMSASEAYSHLVKLLENINAVASTFITSDAMQAAASSLTTAEVDIDDDKQLIFAPERGNVLFASAADCWAFDIAAFAALYSRVLGMKEAALQQCLWGDFYYSPKEKKVMRKPTGKVSKPMFVQLVLEPLWQVYEAAVSDEQGSADKVVSMMERLGVAVTQREVLKERDKRRRLQNIMQRWLPIPACVLGCVVDQLPSPIQAQKDRLSRVWTGEVKRREGEDGIRDAMCRCDRQYSEVMVYVTKMVDYGEVLDRMRERSRQGRGQIGVRKAYVRSKGTEDEPTAEAKETVEEQKEQEQPAEDKTEAGGPEMDTGRFLGFARVFAGTLDTSSAHQLLHVYLPRYHPLSSLHHVTIPVSSLSLYLFMGVDIQSVTRVPAGNVCGIAGLDEVVLKSATLSSIPPPLSPFTSLSFQSPPIMRVALEPESALDFPRLRAGLTLLSHADPNVVLSQTERGETVLVVSGELHLERCVRDLKDRFAVGVGVRVSEPLVAFREGVVREDEAKKDEVDFRAKKDREKERRGKEKERKGRRKDDEDEDDSKMGSSSSSSSKEPERRKHKERQRDSDDKDTNTLEPPVDRQTAASPSPSGDEEGSHIDTSSSLDPLDKATKHKHEVEEWTAGRGVMIRVRCVPLGKEVSTVLEEARDTIRRMAVKREREERKRKAKRAEQTAGVSELPAAAAAESIEQKQSSETYSSAERSEASQTGEAPQPSPKSDDNGEHEEVEAEEGEEVDEDDLIARRSANKYTPASFLAALRSLFGSPACPDLTADDVDRLWSFGPKRIGPNLLINRTDLSVACSFTSPVGGSAAVEGVDVGRLALFRVVESGIVNGFQLATSAGPMCEEPMMGVAFVITQLTLTQPDAIPASVSSAPSSVPSFSSAALPGQVISSARTAFRRAFLSHSHQLRLLESIYLVDLQCSSTELGHLYPVLSRRRARIVAEDMQEGTNLFLITAYLPLAESFGFSSEVRKATGGEAQPQLIFSHWELMEQDPYWMPRTEEDIERAGVLEEGRNVAKEWLEKVRKRKGLFVQEKVVEHAEKQRTLARKK